MSSLTTRTKKVILGAAAVGAAGVVIAGCGGSDNAQSRTTAAPASAQNQPTPQAGGGAGVAPGRTGPTGAQLSTLAKQLGVSTDKLQTAMEKTRPTPGQPPTTDPATALAKELNLPVAKVRQVMSAFRPQGGPPSGAPPAGAQPGQGVPPAGGTQGQTPQAPTTTVPSGVS